MNSFDEQEEIEELDELEDSSTTTENDVDEDKINEDEPVETPDSSHFEIDESPILNPKAKIKSESLKKLIKPYFIGISCIIAVIVIIALLIYCTDFDLSGIGNTKPEYYQVPACGKVYLTWEKNPSGLVLDPENVDITDTDTYEYEEYTFDDFVTGVVWTDNEEALDVDNSVVYQAMAIAARSKLIANLPDNCVVLRDYDEQAKHFTKLNGDEEKYSEIKEAVRLSNGLIIGKEEEIFPAEYDIFEYTRKKMDDNEEYSGQYYYHMKNENEEGPLLIPAEWVDELEKEKGDKIPKKHVSNTEKLKSLSLYGAKYLLEKVDSQYELYRILKTFYGTDIKYYTISYGFSNEFQYVAGCSPISMNNTVLTKEEFVLAAQNYGNSRGGGAKILADNAAYIYDMATFNNLNPELVFVRADVEGYSPGESKNNYWGLGCTNTGGYNACISYDSLEEGVLGFLRYISNYSSLTDLMSRYAYLGDYWYNPGSWSTGGCVYASAIYGENIPEYVRNACMSGKTCTTAGGDDCVPTRDEDKQAYLVFQSQSMVDARKKIFGLDADACNYNLGIGEIGQNGCTIWAQGDSNWSGIRLGASSTNMARSGCAVTSIAIAMSCTGSLRNDVNFNPGIFVNKLNEMNGFTIGGGIYWANAAISYFAPSFRYSGGQELRGTAAEKVAQVQNLIEDRTTIIIHVRNEDHTRGHYSVLQSISGTNFVVYDPAGGRINTYAADDTKDVIIYKY